MDQPEVSERLKQLNIEDDLSKEIFEVGRLKKVRQDSIVIGPGVSISEMPFVLDGLLRVMQQDENGNEMFLYYLEGGDTCAMSITCCIEGTKSRFKVIAEQDSVLWMVPMGYIDRWTEKYRSFRRYVFSSYQVRFNELLNTIDSVTFHRMDERLYKYLLDQKQATGSYVINKTHEKIASELNTSRVVISRLLKKLEQEEKIEQYRNRIEIL